MIHGVTIGAPLLDQHDVKNDYMNDFCIVHILDKRFAFHKKSRDDIFLTHSFEVKY